MFRKLFKNTRGATAVEFAVVSPFLFVFLFGLVETGRMLFAKQEMNYIVSIAAREVMLGDVDPDQALSAAVRDKLIVQKDTEVAQSTSRVVVDGATYAVMTLNRTYEVRIPLVPEMDVAMTSSARAPL
jgi:Flp pilus assembly protein TadG